MKKRAILGISGGLLSGGIFLYLALRGIDFPSVAEYLRGTEQRFFLPVIIMISVSFLIRSYRWRCLLRPLGDFKVGRVFPYLVSGFFLNAVIPLRAGEFIRAYLLGRNQGISPTAVLATVVIERVFDALSFLVMMLGAMFFLPFPSWVKVSFYSGIVLFLLVSVLIFLAAFQENRLNQIFGRLPLPVRLKKIIGGIAQNFLFGLRILREGKTIFWTSLLSLLLWLIEVVSYILIARAFSIFLPFLSFFFIVVMIGIGVILPPAPGYIGSYEFFGITALTILGIERELALSYIVVLHFLQLAVLTAWGLPMLFRLHLSWREVEKAIRKH